MKTPANLPIACIQAFTMPRYPKYARKPRKPWKGSCSLPGVVGEGGYGLPVRRRAQKSHAQKFADKNKRKPTRAESAMGRILARMGLKHLSQWAFAGKWILDFYLPDENVGIEVDGSIHESTEQQSRDSDKTNECKNHGIRLIRFSNQEVLKKSDVVESSLRKFIAGDQNASDSNPAVFNDFDVALSYLKAHGGVLKKNGSGTWFIRGDQSGNSRC